ncbi:hypothetical protein WI82_24990 [Burkholderia ubonensis]|nr:hypothetical protein WI82_24990 [Burkholderia ubonensis]
MWTSSLAVGFDFVPDEFASGVPVQVVEDGHPPAGLPVKVREDMRAIVEQFIRQRFRLHTDGPGSLDDGNHTLAVEQRIFRPQFFNVQRHEVLAPMRLNPMGDEFSGFPLSKSGGRVDFVLADCCAQPFRDDETNDVDAARATIEAGGLSHRRTPM